MKKVLLVVLLVGLAVFGLGKGVVRTAGRYCTPIDIQDVGLPPLPR